MPDSRITIVAPLGLLLLLQACAAVPPQGADAGVAVDAGPVLESGASEPAAGEAVPELKLNIPHEASCTPVGQPAADYTFLEKGYHALQDGRYDDAMENFQRYQRLEAASSPEADEEARIAIAYVRSLPESPFYNPRKARNAYEALRQQSGQALAIHDYTRLMLQSLRNLLAMQARIDALEAGNAALKEDLQKREEALKRLRDLTLNQKGAAQ